jgi:hypothetical protein
LALQKDIKNPSIKITKAILGITWHSCFIILTCIS